MKLQTTDHIYNSAVNYYSDKLHYHNFSHIKDTLNHAENILKECDSKKITYDVKVVCHAILFHDAGYNLNHSEKGFKNKESYSAVLAENALSAVGESEEHIKKVTRAILSTHMDGKCQTNDDAIVRAADLSGLAAPYTDFIDKSIALFKERQYLSGEKISWEQYKKEASAIICGFLKSKIELDTDLFSKGNDMFHRKVLDNLDKLMQSNIA
ncbi:MAG: hypothetical protein ACPHLK_04685 [Gammaproteobacteria bacterium]|jgi:predicted metal-dependent HD superfamily phosphohydrolase